jgi:hypothetical protein
MMKVGNAGALSVGGAFMRVTFVIFGLLAACGLWLASNPRQAPLPVFTATASTASTAPQDEEFPRRVKMEVAQDETPPNLPEVPVTWTALGPNVYVETIRDPVAAAALLLADRAARTGEVAGGAETWTQLPRQLVMWQKRDPSLRLRAIVTGNICCQDGVEIPLEHLLTCFDAGKDHESVISARFDAEHLHIALLASGLKPGKPASFVNEKREFDYKPATGDKVRVWVQYVAKGKVITHRAQRWAKRSDNGAELNYDWVFAGSKFWPDEEGRRPPWYGGNEGRVICTSNFINAVLDLPFSSPDADPNTGGLMFRANAKLIPPRNTPVTVIMEAMPAEKK